MQKWEWHHCGYSKRQRRQIQQLDTQSNTILSGTASLWNNGCSTAIIPSQQPPHHIHILSSSALKINLQAAPHAPSLKTHSKLWFFWIQDHEAWSWSLTSTSLETDSRLSTPLNPRSWSSMQFDHVKSLKNQVVDQCSKLDEEEAFITHSPNLRIDAMGVFFSSSAGFNNRWLNDSIFCSKQGLSEFANWCNGCFSS